MSLGWRSEIGLAGEEAEAGGPGIPGVDDGAAGDEVVQGAVLALYEDAEEAEPKEQEAEREHQGADDAPPWFQHRAVCRDDADAERRHAEGAAAHRPRVAEVHELPEDEEDGHDDIRAVQLTLWPVTMCTPYEMAAKASENTALLTTRSMA